MTSLFFLKPRQLHTLASVQDIVVGPWWGAKVFVRLKPGDQSPAGVCLFLQFQILVRADHSADFLWCRSDVSVLLQSILFDDGTTQDTTVTVQVYYDSGLFMSLSLLSVNAVWQTEIPIFGCPILLQEWSMAIFNTFQWGMPSRWCRVLFIYQ